jgi:MoxR-like ATPase
VPDNATYVYNEDIILAVNVALATHRPLLLAGSPGTGKTALAANVAYVLGWRFYPRVITSRTRARDLMWSFDALRRLGDAQASVHVGAGSLRSREAYIEPQVLWWAFDSDSARWRGGKPEIHGITPAADPGLGSSTEAVVLLDEIDKAEPDLPNDLLEALDTKRFTIEELEPPRTIEASHDQVLTFITTNGERELPAAFTRRCIVLKLESPTLEWLVSIANFRFGIKHEPLHRAIAKRLQVLRDAAVRQNMREPSTAEYLDALAACQRLGIDQTSPQWRLLEQAVLWKREDALPPPE